MKEFEVVYLPIGVPTFHLESAEEQFRASRRMLKRICGQVTAPDNMLLSIELLAAFMDQTDPSPVCILLLVPFINAFNSSTEKYGWVGTISGYLSSK